MRVQNNTNTGMGTVEPEHIPTFQNPTETDANAVDDLLNENFIVETDGVDYHTYRVLNCIDKLEIAKSGSMQFMWRDENAYLNTAKCFLEIEFYAYKVLTDKPDEPLVIGDAVGALNPMAHCLIDSVQINIGETLLEDNPKMNQFLTKYMFLTQYSKQMQESFLQKMESSYYDAHESLSADIASTISSTGVGTAAVHKAKTVQGQVCLDLLAKKKTSAIFMPISALQSLDTLIPANIDVSFRFQIADSARFFVSSVAASKPLLKITSAKMHVQACLLKPECLIRVHSRLSGGGSLQLPYVSKHCTPPLVLPSFHLLYLYTFTNISFFQMAYVTRTFTVEVGHVYTWIDISLKSEYQSVIVLLHKNTTMIGSMNTCMLAFERHNLIRAYLENGLQIK